MDHGHLSFTQARSVFMLAGRHPCLARFSTIPPVDEAIRSAAFRRLDVLTKPRGALGRLEPLAAQVCAIQGTLDVRIVQPVGIVFAADHGVADRGVSAYPREVTAQMVANFLHGGAAISVLAKLQGIELWIVDAGVDGDCGAHPRLIEAKIRRGTRNFIDEPAMTPEECAGALQWGRDVVERVMRGGSNTLILGEMGIGNTAAAAMLTGAVLAGAARQALILVDGFTVTVAAALAAQLNSNVLDYCVFGHCSEEHAHRALLEYLQVQPLLDLGMRLGEGSGAALALSVVRAAVALFTEMATFEGAGVSDKDV